MKIICIGRNYADHANELNNSIPSSPVIFLKPETALLPKKNPFYYPAFTNDLHFETEIVIRINKVGKKIAEKFAHTYYNEIGIGIDFTARDLQQELKKNSLPWEKAKAFDHSAPVSENFISLSALPDVNAIKFEMKLNGEIKQQGNTKNMLFSFDRIIQEVSQFFTLKIGDLIFTGTPAGVGPVKIGDRISCSVEGKDLLKFNVK